MLTVDDIMDEAGLPLLGVVPEDSDVMLAAAAGEALILTTDGGAAEACLRISRRLPGGQSPGCCSSPAPAPPPGWSWW